MARHGLCTCHHAEGAHNHASLHKPEHCMESYLVIRKLLLLDDFCRCIENVRVLFLSSFSPGVSCTADHLVDILHNSDDSHLVWRPESYRD